MIEEFGFTAIVNDVIVEQATQIKENIVGLRSFIQLAEEQNYDIDKLLTEVFPESFDQPKIDEMAKVNLMLKEGVEAHEIISLVQTGHLPELAKSEVQVPLVEVIRNEGHTAIICDVLIRESTKDVMKG